MNLKQGLYLLLLVFISVPIFGQEEYDYYEIDSNEVYVIELKDRTEFIGQIVTHDSTGFTLLTGSGVEVKIPKDRIRKMKIASSQERINAGLVGKNGVEKSTRYPYPNPVYQNYYYSKSAIPLESGSVYYRNTYVLVNSFEVGITNFLAIDAGFETISTLITHEPIFYFTPRIHFRIIDNLYAGVSHFIGSAPDIDDNNERFTAGMLAGLITYGNINDNITLNISYPTLNHEVEPTPSVRISGMKRISGKFALLSDNWILPGEDNLLYDDESPNILSYGVRFVTSSATMDLAFLRSGFQRDGLGIGIPYFSACVKF